MSRLSRRLYALIQVPVAQAPIQDSWCRSRGADPIQRQSQITQAAHQMLASSSDDSEDSEEEGHEWQHQQAGIPKPFNGNSAVPRLDMSKVCMPDCWRKNTAIHASVCVSQLKLASSIDEPLPSFKQNMIV